MKSQTLTETTKVKSALRVAIRAARDEREWRTASILSAALEQITQAETQTTAHAVEQAGQFIASLRA